MSIIYDALKKVEKKDTPASLCRADDTREKPPCLRRPKKNYTLAALLIVFVSLFAFSLFHPKGPLRKLIVIVRGGSFGPTGKERPRAAQKSYKPGSLILEGVINDPEKPLAVINGTVLGIGDTIESMEVTGITAKGASLKDPVDSSIVTLSF